MKVLSFTSAVKYFRVVLAAAVIAGFAVLLCGVGCSRSSAKPSSRDRVDETVAQPAGKMQTPAGTGGMRLVEAIRRICAPKGITPVWVFLDSKGDPVVGVEEPPDGWKWIGYGDEGPRGRWIGDGADPIAAVAKWVEPYRVLDGADAAGILISYDAPKKSLYLFRTR